MANPILQELRDQIENTIGVEASAITFINGIPALIDAKVQEALDNGATAEQLSPFEDLKAEMQQSAQDLANAILARSG